MRFPGDAVVVGDAAFGRDAQFLENVMGRAVVELVAVAKPVRNLADDLPVLARLAGRTYHLAMMDDAALYVGRGAFIFFHQRAGEHDVGILRGFGEEELDVDVELQLLQRSADVICVRQRDRGIEADGEQPLDLAFVNRFDQRHSGKALAGDRFFRHAPHAGDVLAVLGIRDIASTGQLIALLSLLARALAVALAGDHRVAAAFAADTSAGDHQVDGRDAVIHALGVVLDAARMQQEAGRRRAPHLGGADDHLRRHAGNLRRVLRRVLLHRSRQLARSRWCAAR